jgi:cytochrome c biogenesis protein ResB
MVNSIVPKLAVRINDFWITYTKTKTVAVLFRYFSFEYSGNETERKTISVNYPLVNKGIYYYQTDWNLIGISRFE